MKRILFLIVLLTASASPLFAFEFIEKTNPGEMIDAAGYHWAGPFKALSIMAAQDNAGQELIGIRLAGLTIWPASSRKMDWSVMQAAFTSGRAVWLWMNADRSGWFYIAVGMKPPDC